MTKAIPNIPFDLSEQACGKALEQLQSWLPALIACALRLKQAHWNLRGRRFKTVHEQLDEILASVRAAVDDTAERIATLGGAADGLPEAVAARSPFAAFPQGLLTVDQAIDSITDDLAVAVQRGRRHIRALGEVDPVSEGLAIGIVGALEKHHWMLRSQRDL